MSEIFEPTDRYDDPDIGLADNGNGPYDIPEHEITAPDDDVVDATARTLLSRKPKNLEEIVAGYDKSGYDPQDFESLQEVMGTHYQEILSCLTCIPRLPMHDMELEHLASLSDGQPTVIEEPVTVDAIRDHLQSATSQTREICLDVFKDGTQLFLPGTTETVRGGIYYNELRSHAIVDFHTHPGPNDIDISRKPSMEDLQQALNHGRPLMIGSTDGITYVPLIENAPDWISKLWEDYVVAQRGFDPEAFNAYGGDRIYAEFITDIIRPTFYTWEELDGNATLLDVARQLTRGHL